MQTFLYSVFDNKAKVFCRPFVCLTDDAALRDFHYAALHQDSDISRHPNDFCLYRIGAFQDVTGLLVPEPALVNLGLASLALDPSTSRFAVISTPTTTEV